MLALLLVLMGCGKGADTTLAFAPMKAFEMPPNVTDLVRHENRLFALDLGGQVVAYDWDGDEKGSFQVDVFTEESCGLISMVFDPDFDASGLVYFGVCESMTHSGIIRAHLDIKTLKLTDRVDILLYGDDDASQAWHNIGWLGFGDDGALIGLFGEKTVRQNAQDVTNPLGSAIRVIPSREPGVGGYTPHPDNPFVNGGGHDAILAWGFRSPWTGPSTNMASSGSATWARARRAGRRSTACARARTTVGRTMRVTVRLIVATRSHRWSPGPTRAPTPPMRMTGRSSPRFSGWPGSMPGTTARGQTPTTAR